MNDKQSDALKSGIPGVLGAAGMVSDMVGRTNEYGRRSAGANIASNAGKYGAMGAQAGAAFGPYGAIIGGAAGVIGGTVKGVIDTNKQKRVENVAKYNEMFQARQASMAQYQAMAASDPGSVFGNQMSSMFAYGGKMQNSYANGGYLKPLSSTAQEVVGPSHEQGGVRLDQATEAEGGETISGDYVFSDRLGFAQLHKPVAKAIGQLEKKPMTPANINSMERLKKKEQSLALVQEVMRRKLNLP